MWELFQKGGPVMYPIALCSIFALAIFLERLWTYHRTRKQVRDLVHDVEPLVAKQVFPVTVKSLIFHGTRKV